MKKWKFTSAILAIALMLGACGTTEEGSTAEGTNETAVVENETTASGNEAAGEETAVESTATYPLTVSPTVGSSESEENGTINFEDVTFEKCQRKSLYSTMAS